MADSEKIYTDAIRKQFRVYFGNWPPGRDIALGDYGYMNDRVFTPEGNIRNLNIKFNTHNDPTGDHYNFASTKSVKVQFFPKGSISQTGLPNIKAAVKIDFGNENSVFFNAAGIKHSYIEDPSLLRETILSLLNKGTWPKNRVIVTQLVKADSSTIIISGKSGATTTLEAEAEAIPSIDLADASIKLSVRVEDGIQFKIISKQGLAPMLGLYGIKSKVWLIPGSKDEFEPKLMKARTDVRRINRHMDNKM